MSALNKQLLQELQRQNRLMEEILSQRAASPDPAPAADPIAAGLMTDHDCLLICMADDVAGAIDRWNKSRGRQPKRAH